ncbi:hypothetical protein JW964_02745 [candidate division KSB1 bacterium]|nr:hypothetical protein [candidate division KSB1 bacterium]
MTQSWCKQICKLLLSVILIAVTLQPAAGQSELNWNKLTHSWTTIYFQQPDLEIARQIILFINEMSPAFSQQVNLKITSPIDIFICPSQMIFNSLTRGQIPEWSEAVSIPGRNAIILKSPLWSQSRRTFRATLIHELVHILIAQNVQNSPVPTWLHEGLAVYFSGEAELASSAMVGKALTTNSLIPLNRIDYVLTFQRDKAILAYQQSYLVVKFIIDNYGFSAIPQLLEGFQQHQSLDEIFEIVTRMSFSEFETHWQQFIRKDRRWDIILDVDNLLWTTIGILFIVAVIALYIRNRKRVKEWEQSE